MNKTNKMLVGLLGVQALLLVLTWAGGAGSAGSNNDSEPLIDVSAESITALNVEGQPTADKPAESVTLEKRGESWVVATADDYPADGEKVDEVVKKLVEARIRAPLATNKANHNALNVGDREFSKKVTLRAGDVQHALVVGSGKGSSVHARFADKDEVFLARGISAWAISERVRTYVKGDYVSVEAPTQVRVVGAGGARTVTLSKGEDGEWTVGELAAGLPVDEAKVSTFVNSARNVQLAAPVGKASKAEFGLGDAATVVTLKSEKGETTYRIGALVDGKYYLKADDNEYVVLVSKFAVEKMVDDGPDKFVKEKEAPAPPSGRPGLPPGLPPGMNIPGLQ
jgi:hypothetical protein